MFYDGSSNISINCLLNAQKIIYLATGDVRNPSIQIQKLEREKSATLKLVTHNLDFQALKKCNKVENASKMSHFTYKRQIWVLGIIPQRERCNNVTLFLNFFDVKILLMYYDVIDGINDL